jgi:hypothetical protein
MKEHTPKIATGDEALAIRLEEFIKFYVPSGWICSIHEVDFAPFFSAKDIKLIRENKEKYFSDKGWVSTNLFGGNKWYVVEAIKEFCKKEME